MTKAETLQWLKQWYDTNKARLQSQAEIVSAIKADYEVEKKIHDLYFALFNKALGGCGNCLADALAELLHYSRKDMEKISNCRFKLRAGGLLIDSKSVLPVATNANLTDELAIAYLQDNIERKSMFEVLPDNLEELLKADNAPQGEENAESVQITTETKSAAETQEKAYQRRGRKRK